MPNVPRVFGFLRMGLTWPEGQAELTLAPLLAALDIILDH
jgi:hypothetical protein